MKVHSRHRQVAYISQSKEWRKQWQQQIRCFFRQKPGAQTRRHPSIQSWLTVLAAWHGGPAGHAGRQQGQRWTGSSWQLPLLRPRAACSLCVSAPCHPSDVPLTCLGLWMRLGRWVARHPECPDPAVIRSLHDRRCWDPRLTCIACRRFGLSRRCKLLTTRCPWPILLTRFPLRVRTPYRVQQLVQVSMMMILQFTQMQGVMVRATNLRLMEPRHRTRSLVTLERPSLEKLRPIAARWKPVPRTHLCRRFRAASPQQNQLPLFLAQCHMCQAMLRPPADRRYS